MKAEGDIEGLIRRGLLEWEPLPDWVTYLQTAENMYVAPWQMFEPEETQPPAWWWRETRMLFDGAIAEAKRQAEAKRK
jgi:hypothetical protein